MLRAPFTAAHYDQHPRHHRPSRPPKLSIRVSEANRLHHPWNNNGTWWLHYTEHLADFTKRRVRRSLRTHDLELAIRRRDEALNSVAA